MTSKTNIGLVAWAQSMLGQPYWYGTCCYKATSSLLASKTKQYPDHYKASRTARFKADIAKGATVADCIGLVKGFYWCRDDGKIVYGLDGRPDKGANGMFNVAKIKGTIDTLPEIPGLLLYSPGHAGVYIGGGWAIEARGFDYGVCRTEVKKRKWMHWYQCPYIEYLDNGTPLPPPEPRVLRYTEGAAMMHGDDVRWVQETLLLLGYQPGKVDGYYGPDTAQAVGSFQAGRLEVDHVVGSETRKALEEARKAAEAQGQDTKDEPNQGQTPQPAPAYGTRLLKYVKGRKMQTGEDVRAIQIRLSTLGHDPGKLDGIYGPKSEAAVTSFQTERGIKVDGIVGPETRTAIQP